MQAVASTGSATAAKPKCPYDYVKVTWRPQTEACLSRLEGRWIDCVYQAVVIRKQRGTSVLCASKRGLYLQALINSRLPRIKTRNRLIDFVGSVERYCYPGEYLACGEIERAEREIRKLAP